MASNVATPEDLALIRAVDELRRAMGQTPSGCHVDPEKKRIRIELGGDVNPSMFISNFQRMWPGDMHGWTLDVVHKTYRNDWRSATTTTMSYPPPRPS